MFRNHKKLGRHKHVQEDPQQIDAKADMNDNATKLPIGPCHNALKWWNIEKKSSIPGSHERPLFAYKNLIELINIHNQIICNIKNKYKDPSSKEQNRQKKAMRWYINWIGYLIIEAEANYFKLLSYTQCAKESAIGMPHAMPHFFRQKFLAW